MSHYDTGNCAMYYAIHYDTDGVVYMLYTSGICVELDCMYSYSSRVVYIIIYERNVRQILRVHTGHLLATRKWNLGCLLATRKLQTSGRLLATCKLGEAPDDERGEQ